MELKLNYVLTGEECVQRLGALYIAECTKRSCWNTGRFKRIRAEVLKDIPEERVEEILKKCKQWYSKGVPKTFVIDLDTFQDWQRVLFACAKYDTYQEEKDDGEN